MVQERRGGLNQADALSCGLESPLLPSSSPSALVKSMGLNEHKWDRSWLLRCCGKSAWKLASIHLSTARYWISADSSNNDNRYGQSHCVFSLEEARFLLPACRQANHPASSRLSAFWRFNRQTALLMLPKPKGMTKDDLANLHHLPKLLPGFLQESLWVQTFASTQGHPRFHL